MRSVDGDATNGGGRGRGIRHEEAERGAVSEEDGDNDESKVDSDSARRGPLSSVRGNQSQHVASVETA